MSLADYYEFLQISPHADPETIHRVYRYLAKRYHPDNPTSGSADKFNRLKTAYDVLSDPGRRSEYDARREMAIKHPIPLSTSIDFMDNLDGELNRRLGVLAVLYYRRRGNPYAPEVALAEVEAQMGFPRDYLDFTTWYLEKKGYITRADNSDFTLTVAGVDFVESQRANLPVLNNLLTTGSESMVGNIVMEEAEASAEVGENHRIEDEGQKVDRLKKRAERRRSRKDRRLGQPDPRTNRVDRRFNAAERRVTQMELPVLEETAAEVETDASAGLSEDQVAA
jgi:hypothetical protein